jgi:hypothetical protein
MALHIYLFKQQNTLSKSKNLNLLLQHCFNFFHRWSLSKIGIRCSSSRSSLHSLVFQVMIPPVFDVISL